MKVVKAGPPVRKKFTESRDGKVVSLVEMIIIPDLFGRKPSAYIHKVYTDEPYQGRGLASELVLKALKYAEKVGCYKVFLLCHGDVSPFYERLHFQRDQWGMAHRL